MTQILNNLHIDLIIDGAHRVQGLADDDRPYEFGDPGERFTITRSKNDGGMYGMSNNVFGGPFTIRLSPTSPSAQWFIARNEEQKDNQLQSRPTRIFNATLSDRVQGRFSTMKGGLLNMCPDQVEPNQTFEVQFVFQLIRTNNAGARFDAPLSNSLQAALQSL